MHGAIVTSYCLSWFYMKVTPLIVLCAIDIQTIVCARHVAFREFLVTFLETISPATRVVEIVLANVGNGKL